MFGVAWRERLVAGYFLLKVLRDQLADGIAAARRIQAENRKVIVIEATGQIGGRCLTDSATFEVPFDRGARWLHNPDTNPIVKLARSAGLDVAPAPPGQKIRVGRRNA